MLVIESEWTEEAISRFEILAHTAKWKSLQARTLSYRQDAQGPIPCLKLVDTNGPQVSIETREAPIIAKLIIQLCLILNRQLDSKCISNTKYAVVKKQCNLFHSVYST